MVWQMGMMRVEPRIFVWRATASQRAYDTNVYVISRHEHPWEEGWWCMVILCLIAWKVLKPQHFSFTQGLPASVRRRCFMKSIPWEIPSWKLWSQSLPWPKSARQLGTGWIKCSYIWNFEWCRIVNSFALYQILNYALLRVVFVENSISLSGLTILRQHTSTISKTQLQLWNRKSPIHFGFARR